MIKEKGNTYSNSNCKIVTCTPSMLETIAGRKECNPVYVKLKYSFLALLCFIATMVLMSFFGSINGYAKAFDFFSIALILSFPLAALYKAKNYVADKITKETVSLSLKQ